MNKSDFSNLHANTSVHQKINLRSHFQNNEPRNLVPYSKDKLVEIYTAGYDVGQFRQEPYDVRMLGKGFSKEEVFTYKK